MAAKIDCLEGEQGGKWRGGSFSNLFFFWRTFSTHHRFHLCQVGFGGLGFSFCLFVVSSGLAGYRRDAQIEIKFVHFAVVSRKRR